MRISPYKILQIKKLASGGASTKDIARHVGLAPSTVHKVRSGVYDRRLQEANAKPAGKRDEEDVVWCPCCRCHVFSPCRLCQLRRHLRGLRAVRAPAPLPADISDPEIIQRLRMNVAEIGLPLRVVNRLHEWGLLTVNDLLHCRRDELLGFSGFAEMTLNHIYACLERLEFVRASRGKKRCKRLRKAR